MNPATEKDLLFGLLALQVGLVNQSQLVAAFQAWTRDRARTLADQLVARGDIDCEDRAAVLALVVRHESRPRSRGNSQRRSVPSWSTRSAVQTRHSPGARSRWRTSGSGQE
jgi:hypothetical protein